MTTPRQPHRSPCYLAYIRRQTCALCSKTPCDPHHVRIRGTGAMGRKVSDYQSTPLCLACHRAVHDHPVTLEQRVLMAESAVVLHVAWMEGRR
jgi:hypothetical protein